MTGFFLVLPFKVFEAVLLIKKCNRLNSNLRSTLTFKSVLIR